MTMNAALEIFLPI